MFTFVELEKIAAEGGYDRTGRDLTRITIEDVHRLQTGLARCSGADASQAAIAVARLRRWIIHGDGIPPPVRGAGYLHSNRETWMAYTRYETPALVRGRMAALGQLRSSLAVAAQPDYDGSLAANTNPKVVVGKHHGSIILRSPLGSLALSPRDASNVEHWLSITMRPPAKNGVLCLPAQWTDESPETGRGESGPRAGGPPGRPGRAGPLARGRRGRRG